MKHQIRALVAAVVLCSCFGIKASSATPVVLQGAGSDYAHLNLYYYAPGTSVVSQDLLQSSADSLNVVYDAETRNFQLSAMFSIPKPAYGSFPGPPPAWWQEPLALIFTTTLHEPQGEPPYELGAEQTELTFQRGSGALFSTLPNDLTFWVAADGSLERFYLASAGTAAAADGSPSAVLEFILSAELSSSTVGILDLDHDGVSDFADQCPFDPGKSKPGLCGCGTPETDLDIDSLPNCLDADDDADGIDDAQEALDGSDPLDRGSALVALQSTVCSDWNGFLDAPGARVWNVLENMNLSAAPQPVNVSLYDAAGIRRSEQSAVLGAFNQLDILLHELPGWAPQAYGKVCSSVDSIGSGELSGRIAVYRTADSQGPNRFQFGYTIPVSSGLRGAQAVQFNTYQPSLALDEAANAVANWLQLTNTTNQEQFGRLRVFGESGSTEQDLRLRLPPNSRRDFPLHALSSKKIGFALWQPNSPSAAFQLRNVRYIYDNPVLRESFSGAAALEGRIGSGRELSAPVDTRNSTAVLELSNVSGAAVSSELKVFDVFGELLLNTSLTFAPFETRHVILDAVLVNSIGTASIRASRPESLIATVLEYGRTAAGGINYLYAVHGAEPLGTTLHSSYNTFLGQSCVLQLTNPTAQPQRASVQLFTNGGEPKLPEIQTTVPAHSVTEIALCSTEEENRYGLVTVLPQAPNTLLAALVRRGPSDDYRFAVELRQ